MKRMMKFLNLSVMIFQLMSGLEACTLNFSAGTQGTQESISVPTVTRVPEGGQSATPIAAEEVVFAFLTAYEDNPDQMIPFLSAELRENLPEGGVLGLLGFEGTLEGLVFTSGTTSANPNLAVVEARLQADGVEILRVFHLSRAGDSWVITGVEKPQ
jgi:hypothetical protein